MGIKSDININEESLYNKIFEKENEIKIIKTKLSRFPL